MGTPTATPPAWLSKKYPEILNATIEGNQYYHGMRQHHNMSSEVYLEKTDHLVQAMAEHYKGRSGIIGWQIDNEVNCEIASYYAESDRSAFRTYMQKKYQTIEAFNQAMGADFWNQTYSDWEEIDLPRLTPQNSPNPHLALEEKRFISELSVGYIARQAYIIRKNLKEEQFITTNGLFPNVDYHSLAKARSISPIFGIMEQQVGGGGWNTRLMQPAPKPGQMRLWAMQSVAHGADYISFFRFRTSDVGTEIYWTGLFDPDDRENRRVRELKRIREDFQKIEITAGSFHSCKVGILLDYDNEWDSESDVFLKPLRNISTDAWFRALQKRHIPFDFIDLRDQMNQDVLKTYEVLIYPHASILTENRISGLTDYVKEGGKLVLGARTGIKNLNGHMLRQTAPGPARGLVGGYVEDVTLLGPADLKETILWKPQNNGMNLHDRQRKQTGALHLNEVLHAETAEVLATYVENYYQDAPALLHNTIDAGEVYYFGAAFEEDTVQALLDQMELKGELDFLELPAEVEVTVREKNEARYYFILNYKQEEKILVIKKKARDLLTKQEHIGEVVLEGYGVMVLEFL